MAEPITVLHVIDCLNVGGTERQLFELMRRHNRARVRPLLATFKREGELMPHLQSLGIEPMFLELGGSLTSPQAALSVARLAWICRRESVRIVHAHDFYSNIVGVAAAQLARVPSIASRRDLAHWLSPMQRRALELALKLSDRVIANAQAVGEHVVRAESVRRDKLCVVPNGIDVEHFDAEAARAPVPPLPPPSGKPRIAMVASMHLRNKGHADAIDAAALLRARGIDAEWWFVSDGVLRAPLEAKARTEGIDAHFLGRRGDMPAVWSQIDLALLPSWAEGFPNAVLEAMCAGRAVVATRVGGIPEVLVDGVTGLLVEPRRPAELADALASLLADRKRMAEMGRRGRARVVERFSLARMVAAVESIYEGLLPAARAAA